MNKNRLLPDREPAKSRRKAAASLAIALTFGGIATEGKNASNLVNRAASTVSSATKSAEHSISHATEHWANEQTTEEVKRVKELPEDKKLKITVDPNGESIWNIAESLLNKGSDPRELTDLMQAELHGDESQIVEVPLDMIDRLPAQDLSQS